MRGGGQMWPLVCEKLWKGTIFALGLFWFDLFWFALWFCLVWCGMAWFSLVWYALVWFGLDLFGMPCSRLGWVGFFFSFSSFFTYDDCQFTCLLPTVSNDMQGSP